MPLESSCIRVAKESSHRTKRVSFFSILEEENIHWFLGRTFTTFIRSSGQQSCSQLELYLLFFDPYQGSVIANKGSLRHWITHLSKFKKITVELILSRYTFLKTRSGMHYDYNALKFELNTEVMCPLSGAGLCSSSWAFFYKSILAHSLHESLLW